MFGINKLVNKSSTSKIDRIIKEEASKIITKECIELWGCSNWSEYVNKKQSRSCTDKNNCGREKNKPITSQDCCIENLNCTEWTKCINNKQERNCTDKNDCGTKYNIPELTSICSE